MTFLVAKIFTSIAFDIKSVGTDHPEDSSSVGTSCFDADEGNLIEVFEGEWYECTARCNDLDNCIGT